MAREHDRLKAWKKAFLDAAYAHVVTQGGKYKSRTPKVYQLPDGTRFRLELQHHCVWSALLTLAYDSKKKRTHTWASLTSISYHAAVSETTLKEILIHLQAVGLVRRKRRGYKTTYATRIFIEPVQPGQDWENDYQTKR